jgi:predicted Zn-dependent protease
MRGRNVTAFALGALVFSAMAWAGPSGKEIHDQTIATIGSYEDPELTAYLQGLVNDIISVSELSGEQFTFTLLDSHEINAFATADNYIYINRGLLNYIQNEAQLVSVLAHEVGHVTQKHVSMMPAVAGGTKFLTWLAGALAGNQEVMMAGQAYANYLLKGHGRENELEADG